jgi:hypothetical protein
LKAIQQCGRGAHRRPARCQTHHRRRIQS